MSTSSSKKILLDSLLDRCFRVYADSSSKKLALVASTSQDVRLKFLFCEDSSAANYDVVVSFREN